MEPGGWSPPTARIPVCRARSGVGRKEGSHRDGHLHRGQEGASGSSRPASPKAALRVSDRAGAIRAVSNPCRVWTPKWTRGSPTRKGFQSPNFERPVESALLAGAVVDSAPVVYSKDHECVFVGCQQGQEAIIPNSPLVIVRAGKAFKVPFGMLSRGIELADDALGHGAIEPTQISKGSVGPLDGPAHRSLSSFLTEAWSCSLPCRTSSRASIRPTRNASVNVPSSSPSGTRESSWFRSSS